MKVVLINAVLVGCGGFAGALLRYGLSGLAHRQAPLSTFPIGTVLVNLLGCLLIGIFGGLAESRQLFGPELRLFVMIGLLGGFTTFSTLGYEAITMIRAAEYTHAIVYIAVQLVFGLALAWFGFNLTAAR